MKRLKYIIYKAGLCLAQGQLVKVGLTNNNKRAHQSKHTHTNIYIYMCVYVCVCVYIYIEREREGKRERGGRCTQTEWERRI